MNVYETSRLAKRTTSLCVSEETAAIQTFEELVCTLRDERVVNLMTVFITRICLLSTPGMVQFPDGETPIAVIKPRTFLAAYLIKYHPDMVFKREGVVHSMPCALQQDLQDAASSMLGVFEGIRYELIACTGDRGEASANMIAFPLVTLQYMEAFDEWRAWDTAGRGGSWLA